MKKILTLLILLMSVTIIAQNGINYKAIIKDNSGNVVANDLIAVQFTILQGVAQTNVYQETHTPTTDANGIIIINIGEGTTSDVFTDIDWSTDNHFLNVQVNTGGGLTDLGTTQFMHVPYAIQSERATTANNVTGLEAIDEGNGIGWRLTGRNLDNYGDVGFNAVDFTYSNINTSSIGATGNHATTFGFGTYADGQNSIAIGFETEALGSSSLATGRITEAIGNFSSSFGVGTRSQSYASLAIGRLNLGGGSATTWNDFDPLFEVGNGTNDLNRSNALTIRKNGTHIINSSATGLSIPNAGYDGITVTNAGLNGISISHSTLHGLTIFGANRNGVNVSSADEYGASITGTLAGIRTTSSIPENPDIILRGNSSANSEDDGIISSDPAYSGSDLNLRSYGGVIAQLDYDDGESTNFIVRNGDGNDAFSVSEGGVVRQNGTTIHSSDRRLKKDIEHLQYGLDEILQLQPKTYHWKNKEQTHKSLGLIAQEVQPIINEIVVAQEDEAKTLGISYTELIPVLIKAIQEQQLKIQDLEKQLKDQKDIASKQNEKINMLKGTLKTVENLKEKIKYFEKLEARLSKLETNE